MTEAEKERAADEADRCEDCGLRSCVCYDDENTIWCERCAGTGSIDCYCCGDFCCCANGGDVDCPRCDGQGEFVPSPGQLEREAEHRRQMAEIMSKALNTPQPDACGSERD